MSSPLTFYMAIAASGYLVFQIFDAHRRQNVALSNPERTGYVHIPMVDYTGNVHMTRSEQQRVRSIKPEGKVVQGYAIKWCVTNMDGSKCWVHMTPQKINQKFKIVPTGN